jgi:hypothetical protein
MSTVLVTIAGAGGGANFSGGVRVPERKAASPASKSIAEPTNRADSSGAT